MPSGTDRFKLYAVSKGRRSGIYDNWALAEQQVAGFSGSVFKGFNSERAAEKFMQSAGITKPKYIVAEPQSESHSNSSSCNTFATSLCDAELLNACSTPTRINTNNTGNANTHNISAKCDNCITLAEVVHQLTQRIDNLEHRLSSVNNKDSCINSLDENLTTLTERISKVEHSLKRSYRDATKTGLLPNAVNAGVSASSNPQQHANLKLVNATSKSSTVNKTSIKFEPEKCVVISGTHAEDFRSLKHDTIRHTLSANHGPIMIDKINRYRFQSDNPKYMIQLSSVEAVQKVVNNWNADSFGGSAARATIKPDNNISTGMMRGVPLDIAEDTIQQAVESVYTGASTVRLSKDNKKLRTVKITFKDNDMLTTAVKNGITITSCNMMFRIERPYTTTDVNHG